MLPNLHPKPMLQLSLLDLSSCFTSTLLTSLIRLLPLAHSLNKYHQLQLLSSNVSLTGTCPWICKIPSRGLDRIYTFHLSVCLHRVGENKTKQQLHWLPNTSEIKHDGHHHWPHALLTHISHGSCTTVFETTQKPSTFLCTVLHCPGAGPVCSQLLVSQVTVRKTLLAAPFFPVVCRHHTFLFLHGTGNSVHLQPILALFPTSVDSMDPDSRPIRH